MRLLWAASAVLLVLALSACQGSEKKPDVPVPSDRRVVGYFGGWDVYARDFHLKDVDAGLLTDLVYAFGATDQGRCRPGDPNADYLRQVPAGQSVDGRADQPGQPVAGSIHQLSLLKRKFPKLKVLWSFGGWNNSKGFSEAAKDPQAFAASCREVLDDPRWAGVFDGIDVDWEYPNSCGQTCDTSGRDALAKVVAALRKEFGPDRLITAAITADTGSRLAAADYPAAIQDLDWVNVMTYDYTTTTRGLHEPLSKAQASIAGLTAAGVPARKLLLGIGFYGRGWTGSKPAKGTYEDGIDDYKVLARKCPPTGTVDGTAVAECGERWWSYRTPATVQAKAAWAREQGLGGAFVWELSGDTADHQLLSAVSQGLSAAP